MGSALLSGPNTAPLLAPSQTRQLPGTPHLGDEEAERMLHFMQRSLQTVYQGGAAPEALVRATWRVGC